MRAFELSPANGHTGHTPDISILSQVMDLDLLDLTHHKRYPGYGYYDPFLHGGEAKVPPEVVAAKLQPELYQQSLGRLHEAISIAISPGHSQVVADVLTALETETGEEKGRIIASDVDESQKQTVAHGFSELVDLVVEGINQQGGAERTVGIKALYGEVERSIPIQSINLLYEVLGTRRGVLNDPDDLGGLFDWRLSSHKTMAGIIIWEDRINLASRKISQSIVPRIIPRRLEHLEAGEGVEHKVSITLNPSARTLKHMKTS